VSEAETPIAKSDLPTRFAAGVVMIAVAILATWWGGWWFRTLVAAAAAAMLLEWANMHGVQRLWTVIGMVLLAALLLAGSEYLLPVSLDSSAFADGAVPVIESDTFGGNFIGFAGVALLALLLGLVSRRLTMIGGTLYVGLPAFALIGLDWAWYPLVFWMFIVTWATDILAYFAGRSIGGPKLAPRISPNKTWAGLVGGVIGAGILGFAAAKWLQLDAPFTSLGAPMGLVAQLGDLFESWVKRRAGVKDSGSILPGHGGVLDRLDGLLAVALATCLVLMAGLWTA
jgi:phosphatidate cytidylyltransferase